MDTPHDFDDWKRDITAMANLGEAERMVEAWRLTPKRLKAYVLAYHGLWWTQLKTHSIRGPKKMAG